MISVGIIANPASGKDIRRLIAHGSVFDNQEKVHIVRRVRLGLQAAGVENVVIMPDYFGIGRRALDGLDLKIPVDILEMTIEANQDDSTRAAGLLRAMGVGSVVTLGGDGTNRAVAKEIGDVPIMTISTGTNNVFPQMVEGVFRTGSRLGHPAFFRGALHEVHSDQIPFLEAGVPAALLIDITDPEWHTQRDTLARCSPASLAAAGETLETWLEERAL